MKTPNMSATMPLKSGSKSKSVMPKDSSPISSVTARDNEQSIDLVKNEDFNNSAPPMNRRETIQPSHNMEDLERDDGDEDQADPDAIKEVADEDEDVESPTSPSPRSPGVTTSDPNLIKMNEI